MEGFSRQERRRGVCAAEQTEGEKECENGRIGKGVME